jgi:hypothetical protein
LAAASAARPRGPWKYSQHLLHRPDSGALVDESRDPVGDRVQAIDVMRHQEDGKPHAALQIGDEPVEIGGGDRVEAGGRLVEEEQGGVERQGARQPGALAHAARQFGGKFLRRIGRQADHRDLHGGDLVQQGDRQVEMLAQRHLNVLRDGQRAEQRAVLEEDSECRLEPMQRPGVERRRILAEYLDPARAGPDEPDDGAQQDRFSGARGAHHAHHLAAPHLEVEVVEDDLAAEAGLQPAQTDRRHPGGPVMDGLRS